MVRISARSRLRAQSDHVFDHLIYSLMRTLMDFTPVMGTTWYRWLTTLTPTERASRSVSIWTTSMLIKTLLTVRILKINNIILMTVKLLTMDFNTTARERLLLLLMMGPLRISVQCQRMSALCRYWNWRRRRGLIPLGPYCLDRDEKVYLGGFTNEYCTNCDKYEVSGSSHIESCENATGKEID